MSAARFCHSGTQIETDSERSFRLSNANTTQTSTTIDTRLLFVVTMGFLLHRQPSRTIAWSKSTLCILLCQAVLLSYAWTGSNLQTSRYRRSQLLVRLHDTTGSTSSAQSAALENTSRVATSSASPLSCTLKELSKIVGGTGRAKEAWNLYRKGLDPLSLTVNPSHSKGGDDNNNNTYSIIGTKTYNHLARHFRGSIQDKIAKIVTISTASDGTTKLLMELVQDSLQVETVIIPWPKRRSSTLCISSQVGCRQACTFCQTGRMGILRSLTADEILAQVWLANAVINEHTTKETTISALYPIDNIVFMGMGEPADNTRHVLRAAEMLVDGFQLAPRKITISTVAPTPEAFSTLGKAPALLAWSVHSSRDEIRKELVPTTKYSMVQLRDALEHALLQRSSRGQRNIMLELALLQDINDSTDDALHLAEFCQPLLANVDGLKLTVNLIPWNDIGASHGPAMTYFKPSMDRVLAFQDALVKKGIRCYVRTTRGDEENAACGQLATESRREKLKSAAAEA